MMFRKPKSPPSPEAKPIILPVDTEGGEELPQVEAKSYADEINERVRSIKDMQTSLLKEARSRGVTEAEMPALVADAVNAGKLPRVFRGMAFHGSGQTLILVEGPIKPDEVTVQLQTDEQYPDFFKAIVGIHGNMTNEDGSPRLTFTPNLPQHDRGEPVDHDMLAALDTHIATQTP